MGGDVVGGVNQNKSCEVTHAIQKIGVATVVGDVAGCPKIGMKDIKWATKRPREDKFAVARDGAIRGDAMGALENPISDCFAAVRPKEAETDAMKGLINAHVTGDRRGVISGEDVTAERQRNNN